MVDVFNGWLAAGAAAGFGSRSDTPAADGGCARTARHRSRKGVPAVRADEAAGTVSWLVVTTDRCFVPLAVVVVVTVAVVTVQPSKEAR